MTEVTDDARNRFRFGPFIVGYARTLPADPPAGLEAQLHALAAAGAETVFSDRVSSMAPRPQLDAALDDLRDGELLVVVTMDRLARSTGELQAIVTRLEAKGAGLRVLTMAGGATLDTWTAAGQAMLTMLATVAGLEQEVTRERKRAGIARAKADGRYKGRVPTARNQAADITAMKSAGSSVIEISHKLRMSRMSVYRVLNDVKQTGAT